MQPNFVVAAPTRWDVDNAHALARHGLLRFYALGTRRGAAGVPAELTRLNPKIGLLAYIAAQLVSTTRAESLRFRLLPWFDRWVLRQMQPGDHIISSFGFTNACFRYARQHGGKTFLSAGNSHPEQYWEIMTEEHRRWNCPDPAMAPHWYQRAKEMMEDVDYVLSPSTYVTESFLNRGFSSEKILRNVYPLDLSCFIPRTQPRAAGQPLTIISTGMLSLRKGTPYLLEAFRLVRRERPDARLLLTDSMMDSARPILAKYRDLPIEWAPALPHPQLAERLRSADIYVLPSLEEGLARTISEALACGLPAIVTSHTGANDWIRSGENGEVVPLRDARAIADAILSWGERILSGAFQPTALLDPSVFSYENFERDFLSQLRAIGLAPSAACSSDLL